MHVASVHSAIQTSTWLYTVVDIWELVAIPALLNSSQGSQYGTTLHTNLPFYHRHYSHHHYFRYSSDNTNLCRRHVNCLPYSYIEKHLLFPDVPVTEPCATMWRKRELTSIHAAQTGEVHNAIYVSQSSINDCRINFQRCLNSST